MSADPGRYFGKIDVNGFLQTLSDPSRTYQELLEAVLGIINSVHVGRRS